MMNKAFTSKTKEYLTDAIICGRKVNIYDLDGTVIDSFHRVAPCLDTNGNLDVAMYIETACTPELVEQDTLLPLAEYMQKDIASGNTVVILTARWCDKPDYYFLRKNGLTGKNVIHCSRDRLAGIFGKQEGKRIKELGDAEYKRAWFNHLWHSMPNASFTIFDDHQGVLQAARDCGITAVDATELNKVLASQYVDMFEQGYECAETVHASELLELGFAENIA